VSSAILEARGVTKRYARIAAVSDVDLTLERGEALGLIGESGSGKSTVGRMLAGIIAPSAGAILFDGRDLATLRGNERVAYRCDVQMVFQDFASAFNPRRTIGAQIADPIVRLGVRYGRSAVAQRTAELLELVGLNRAFAQRYPHELSGGQQQRASIARALSVEPRVLVLDEPVSALDVSIRAQIVCLFRDLREHLGLSYVFTAHNLDAIAYLCDRVAVMAEGRVVECGPTRQIFTQPQEAFTRTLLASVLSLRRPARRAC
jgi:ABC-type oligopeptide transport system ATPase subunit